MRVRVLASGGTLIRLACATILFVAAGFKAQQLLTEPPDSTPFAPRWLPLLFFQYEVLLASWLLSGAFQQACRWVALATFTGFGAYVLYLGLSGAGSCGCFGGAQINPWWTFALDSGLVALFWSWTFDETCTATRHINTWRCSAACVVGASAAGILGGMFSHENLALTTRGVSAQESRTIDARTWAGKRFPFLEEVDVAEQLRRGPWTVILFNRECADCRQLLDSLEGTRPPVGERLALIEVAPRTSWPLKLATPHVLGRLENRRRVDFKIPVRFRMVDGIVTAIENAG